MVWGVAYFTNAHSEASVRYLLPGAVDFGGMYLSHDGGMIALLLRIF